MSVQRQVTPKKAAWATGLGVVAALCTTVWFASVGFTVLAAKHVESDIPFFPGIIMMAGLVVTLPIAVICTVIAWMLVGARQAKLAWVSLSLFLLPPILATIAGTLLTGD